MARQRGLRARLDRVENNAHGTMHAIRESLLGLLDDAQDGVTITLVKVGGGSILDFIRGIEAECPFGVRIEFAESVESVAESVESVAESVESVAESVD